MSPFASVEDADVEITEDGQSPTLESSLVALTKSFTAAHTEPQAALAPITEDPENVTLETPTIHVDPPQKQDLLATQTPSESTPPSPTKKPLQDDGQLVKDLMRGQGALEALTQSTATQGIYFPKF